MPCAASARNLSLNGQTPSPSGQLPQFLLAPVVIPIASGAQKTKRFLEEKMFTSRLKQSRVYSANTSTVLGTVLGIYHASGLKPRLLGPSILIGSKAQINRLFRCHMISAVEEGLGRVGYAILPDPFCAASPLTSFFLCSFRIPISFATG